MLKGSTIHQTIKDELINYVPVLNSWTFSDLGNKMLDPYETIYSENYAPANAAVVYASVYNFSKDPIMLENCRNMIRRSIELLKNIKTVSPFCRVFLLHFSLMAISLLPKEIRITFLEGFKEFYANYEDDCKIINTNCAALKYGTEILIMELDIRSVDLNYMTDLLDFILSAQSKKGFINDSVDFNNAAKDGMPIAYHSFILFIIVSVLSVIENDKHIPLEQLNTINKIVSMGISWLSKTVSYDGSFAMAERSSYQVFTWGVYLTLCCYSGINDEAFLSNVLKYWSKYKKQDGSFSCTPNYLSHELRVGFESYTHVNMYNNLAMTGFSIAENIITKELHLKDRNIVEMFFEDINFIDTSSGYFFARRGQSFMGCTLRMHKDKHMPAMTGFHFRINNHYLPIPEPKLPMGIENIEQLTSEGIWEGYLLKDEQGEFIFPSFDQNVEAQALESGISLRYEDENLYCEKLIQISENEIEWNYKLIPKRDFISCEHVIPLIRYDGQNGLKVLEKSANTLNLHFSGNQYQLSCDSSRQIRVELDRSLLSVSGVSSKVSIPIITTPRANQALSWRTSLRFYNSVSEDKTLQEKLNAKDVIPVILNVIWDKPSPQPINTPIRFTVKALGNKLNYAWYIYRGQERIDTKWYTKDNFLAWTPSQSGSYQIRIFIKDSLGYMASKLSEEFLIQ